MDNIFWKNVKSLCLPEVFLKLKGLIMIPFITKYFGTMDYGAWSQVNTLISLLLPLVLWGTDAAIVRYLSGQNYQEQCKVFTGWLIFGLGMALVLCLFTTISHGLLSELFWDNDKSYKSLVYLAGLSIISSTLTSSIIRWFRIQNQAKYLSRFIILQNLLQFFIMLYILIYKGNVQELISYYIILDFIIIFYCLSLFRYKKILTKPSFSWFKKYIHFGIMMLPSGYSLAIMNSIDKVFIVKYFTLSEVGIYALCNALSSSIIQMIVNPIWNLYPSMASSLYNQNKIDELCKIFFQSQKAICFVVFPSISMLFIIGKPILTLLSNNSFAAGYLVLPILLLAKTFLMLSAYYEYIFVLKKKPYIVSINMVVICLLNFSLNLWLIPKYSYIGAALATMAAYFCQMSISYIISMRYKVLKIINWRDLLYIILNSFLLFVILQSITKTFSFDHVIIEIIVYSILGITVYLGLSFLNKVYKFQDLLVYIKKQQGSRI